MFGKEKSSKLMAEFLGTAILTTAIYSMSIRTTFPFFYAAAAGLTLGLLILVLGSVSGAHFNPAVTIGNWTLKKIDTAQALVYIAAQLLGGLAAWKLMEYLIDSPIKEIAIKNVDYRVMVAEGVGALIFGLGIAAATMKAYDESQKAVIIGTSLFVGCIIAAFASNGILNPAVALGVRSVSVSYMVAPIIGVVLGMNLYKEIFSGQKAKTKNSNKK